MINITPSNSPSFGMAVHFNKAGGRFFENAIKNPAQRNSYIVRQKVNEFSNISIKNNKVFVDFDSKKWQILNTIKSKNENGQTSDCIMLLRKGNFFRRPEIQTIVHGDSVQLENRYGKDGKFLAIAEDIADFEAAQHKNQKSGIMNKIYKFLKS